MMTTELTITLPKLHPAQAKITGELRRFNVLDCGRRFGKSLFGIDRAIHPLLAGYPVGWFSPSYKYVTEIWRDLKRALHPVIRRAGEIDKRIELITGGVLEVWSLDDPDAGRSRKYKRVIIDEAAKVRKLQIAWQESIRATLADYQGDAFFLSTPRGMNYFKTLYDHGQDPARPEWGSWQLPTLANPHIDPAEIEAARLDLPERVFRQEYLAEFIEDANIFRNVTASATATPQEKSIGNQYVFGVDWGKYNDFTVVTVLDTVLMEMVAFDRFNMIDYTVQAGRLQALYKRFNPYLILAESNAMGEPVIDSLRGAGLPIQPFVTTNTSKSKIINQLSLAFEQGSIKILNDPVLIAELQAYEAERLPGGGLRYGAPEGQHDDFVISLALGLEAVMRGRRYGPAQNPFAGYRGL